MKELKDSELEQISGGFAPVAAFSFKPGDTFQFKNASIYVYTGVEKEYLGSENVPVDDYTIVDATHAKFYKSIKLTAEFIGTTTYLGHRDSILYNLSR